MGYTRYEAFLMRNDSFFSYSMVDIMLIWEFIVTIGGTVDSTVHSVCTAQDTTSCMAAFAGIHLSASSSAYLQNVWVWTADHNLDGGPLQIISTGRGVLVESTKATWLVGTGSEHHVSILFIIKNSPQELPNLSHGYILGEYRLTF